MSNLVVIKGNILDKKFDVIVQQCSCDSPFYGGRLHGQIVKKYPGYGKKLTTRRRHLTIAPGSIVRNIMDDNKVIYNLYSQVYSGGIRKEVKYSTYYQEGGDGEEIQGEFLDDAAYRYKLFEIALKKLKKSIIEHDYRKIAFPCGIGCGIGEGNWDTRKPNSYLKLITNFAKTIPSVTVFIVKYTHTTLENG